MGPRDLAALTGFSARTITRMRSARVAWRTDAGAPGSLVAAVELLGAEILDPGEAAARLHTPLC